MDTTAFILMEIEDLLEGDQYIRLDVNGYHLHVGGDVHPFPSLEIIYGYLIGKKGFLPNTNKLNKK